MTDPRARTLVVLPTYNEVENVERVVSAVREAGSRTAATRDPCRL